MDAKLKADWVKALRSGKYTQARHGIGCKEVGHLCCLGVGAVVADPRVELLTTDSAVNVLSAYGLSGVCADSGCYTGFVRKLIDMNDEDSASFNQIADYIEANIPSDESVAS